jgi:predicted metalloenzyme YecM
MNEQEIKAYQQKIGAQLQEAKAKLDGFEAHAKGQLAQSEIDQITRLKAKKQEIDKKLHQDLRTAGEVTLAAKIKADIDADMGKFKTLLDQFTAKVKSQPQTKAS